MELQNVFLHLSDRRSFIKCICTLSSLALLTTLGGCEQLAEAIRNRPIRRRIRTGSTEVDQNLEIYKAAVQGMKGLPLSDGRNWVKQANIHGFPSGFNLCQHGTQHFFTWHRAYIFAFERICQKITNEPKFALPYWNWRVDPNVPSQFLDSSSTLFSPRSRNRLSNSVLDIFSAENLEEILTEPIFDVFSNRLEGGPHNTAHSNIGGTLGQGNSPEDPLFWLHHCMIDYCWFDWNINRGQNNPNDTAWINTNWNHFFDADGNITTMNVIETLLMPLLSYQYEYSPIGTSVQEIIAINTKKDFERIQKRIKEGSPINFNIRQRFNLTDIAMLKLDTITSEISNIHPKELPTIFDSTTDERVFVNVNFARLPPRSDFFVRVFINLPKDNSDTSRNSPHYAGSFAFFGTSEEGMSHGAHKEHHPDFLVDITNTLRILKKRGQLAEEPIEVNFVPIPFDPETKLPDTALQLEKVELLLSPIRVGKPNN